MLKVSKIEMVAGDVMDGDIRNQRQGNRFDGDYNTLDGEKCDYRNGLSMEMSYAGLATVRV